MTSERVARWVCMAALAMGACTARDVVVDLYTPAECCTGPGCAQPECPLANVRCVRTTLERVDGTVAFVEELPAPAGLCTVADLEGFVFLERGMQPSDAIEVRIEGRTGEACGGELVVGCDSFGEHVIDLERDTRIAIWCDCPLTPAP